MLDYNCLTDCCKKPYPGGEPIVNQIGCNFCGLEYFDYGDYKHECKCGEIVYLKIVNSGVDYNDYWGMENHWFEAEGKCYKCGSDHHITDSSL